MMVNKYFKYESNASQGWVNIATLLKNFKLHDQGWRQHHGGYNSPSYSSNSKAKKYNRTQQNSIPTYLFHLFETGFNISQSYTSDL